MRTWKLLAFILMVTSPDQDTTIMGDNDNKTLQCSQTAQKLHFHCSEKLSFSLKVIKIAGPTYSKYIVSLTKNVDFLTRVTLQKEQEKEYGSRTENPVKTLKRKEWWIMNSIQSFFKLVLNSYVILPTEHWEHGDHSGPDLTNVGIPWHCFLLPRVSTMSWISRTSNRQQHPVPVWVTLTVGSYHPPARCFFVPPLAWLMSFPFLVIVILSIFPRVLHLLESQICISPLYSKDIHPNLIFLPAFPSATLTSQHAFQ